MRDKTIIIILLAVSGAIFISGGLVSAQSVHSSGSGYLPNRVYDSKGKRFIDFETMLLEITRTEVTFVGEQHDDPATHRLERAILEGLARRGVKVTVAMEMFERDVQETLDDYFAGRMSEQEFLDRSRPWPRYATDYRPIVEFAKVHGWKVLASNTPRRLASKVSREGPAAVDSVSVEDRKHIAAEIKCPFDDYYKRFVDTMKDHPGNDKSSNTRKDEEENRAVIDRFYHAQCVKDETMAESIHRSFNSNGKSLVVHFNGAFHSDYRLGTADRTIRRMPKSKIRVVTIVPVKDLDNVRPDEYRKKADFIVFCLGP